MAGDGIELQVMGDRKRQVILRTFGFFFGRDGNPLGIWGRGVTASKLHFKRMFLKKKKIFKRMFLTAVLKQPVGGQG